MFKKSTIFRVVLSVFLLISLCSSTVSATTIYSSDQVPHEEGFIIIGESHALLACAEFNRLLNTEKEQIINDLSFHLDVDSSISKNQDNEPNTYYMSGNLFFVFEGSSDSDFATQIQREYIYSDGKGHRGIAVTKIHEIIDKNPQIEHWNIISWHGATSIRKGDINAPYYINSYRNWIDYEFPDANVYFISHSTMTKAYRSCKKQADTFNAELKKAFPDNFLDYTDFFTARFPQELLDPEQKGDLIHWNQKTYIELFQSVMQYCLEH